MKPNFLCRLPFQMAGSASSEIFRNWRGELGVILECKTAMPLSSFYYKLKYVSQKKAFSRNIIGAFQYCGKVGGFLPNTEKLISAFRYCVLFNSFFISSGCLFMQPHLCMIPESLEVTSKLE